MVICVNRCRPDFLGCYGNDWIATPAFDALAAESVVFDQHFCTAPDRPPAFLAAVNRLASMLQRQGVHTALLGDERSPILDVSSAEGWSRRHCVTLNDLPGLEQETLLGGAVQMAVNWLADLRRKDNWLLWLELSSLQMPWEASECDEEYVSDQEFALAAQYAGMVSFLDDRLGELIEYLKECGLYDELLLVLTSDRGLPFGEHGVVGDEKAILYEEAVHLPLLVRLPGAAGAGRRVQALTQDADLFATLCEMCGLAVPEESAGKNFLPLARHAVTGLHDAIIIRSAEPESALRTPDWHLITAGDRTQLYLKPEDRWEVNDVAGLYPDVAEELQARLRLRSGNL